MAYRFFAVRLRGDGTDTPLVAELPIRGGSITPQINAGTELSGTIEPHFFSLVAEDGHPLLQPWSTAIFAESDDGADVWGGILDEDSYAPDSQTISVLGYASYPAGQFFDGEWVSTQPDLDEPSRWNNDRAQQRTLLVQALSRAQAAYDQAWAAHAANPNKTTLNTRDAKKKARDTAQSKLTAFDAQTPTLQAQAAARYARMTAPGCPTIGDGTDGVDPIDLFRFLWHHLQTRPRGNLGLRLASTSSSRRIGRTVAATEYDPENDEATNSFEFDERKYTTWDTTDLSQPMMELAEGTPFQFTEVHRWNDPDKRDYLVHELLIGTPRLGRRRHDVRLVIGENVDVPEYATDSDTPYADTILTLGAGEGALQKRAIVVRDGEHRIRRARVVTDSALESDSAARTAAQRELSRSDGSYVVSEVVTLPTADEEVLSLSLGDDARVFGAVGPDLPVNDWYTVTSISIEADTGKRSYGLVRSDRVV